jgi:glucose-1-phosphate adenylyltransferase
VLTESTAKPAVPFGGKYRIIDYSLSNCVNSGIDTVGILTQYQPLELNDYIGNGQPWDLNRNFGGVHVLPPYMKTKDNSWYKGTANAIYQNMHFIDRYNPEYVLILSGDHIYKMDYSKMLKFHKAKGAECTIAVRTVPIEDASRMGIMSTDSSDRITEFEEKPKVPKSNLASMGVYIFSWQTLKKYLIDDENDPNSSNDFGKNVIPALLNDGRALYAYTFDGYWRDVGTLDSLWQANMDILDPSGIVEQGAPKKFKIYSRNYAQPPSVVSKGATVKNAFIAEGCVIKGTVINSVISTGCCVEEGAVVTDSVIMPNSTVKSRARVEYSIVGERCNIGEGAQIGAPNDGSDGWGVAVVGHDKVVENGYTVKPKEIV